MGMEIADLEMNLIMLTGIPKKGCRGNVPCVLSLSLAVPKAPAKCLKQSFHWQLIF
jgi:hypothetical protein